MKTFDLKSLVFFFKQKISFNITLIRVVFSFISFSSSSSSFPQESEGHTLNACQEKMDDQYEVKINLSFYL